MNRAIVNRSKITLNASHVVFNLGCPTLQVKQIKYTTLIGFRLSNLSDEKSLQGDILSSDVRKGHWDNASQSLGLMNDGISVGQLLPVLYPDLTTP